jgi:hypothetical protein
MQKTQFLKALADMWTGFDARVLRYKVCHLCFLCSFVDKKLQHAN